MATESSTKETIKETHGGLSCYEFLTFELSEVHADAGANPLIGAGKAACSTCAIKLCQ